MSVLYKFSEFEICKIRGAVIDHKNSMNINYDRISVIKDTG
jgi:hypothetical protein